jgi:hypothetical protein
MFAVGVTRARTIAVTGMINGGNYSYRVDWRSRNAYGWEQLSC